MDGVLGSAAAAQAAPATRAVAAAAGATGAATAEPPHTLTAISQQLRELADNLDTHGPSSASHVSSSLQQLAQQLLHAGPAHAPAGTAVRNGINATPSDIGRPPVQEATPAATAAAVAAAAAGSAQVTALERSYAAPAVAGADDAELTALQPLTKKQRKAAKAGAQPRVFDFSKYAQRVVVLQLMYEGWSYQGFARQADSDNTIEGVLFPALRRVKLIPEHEEVNTLNYSRCGRTDKGVSALRQVLTLRLRSCVPAGQPLPAPDQELDYATLINRALPDTIRVLGWTDLPRPDFSARFSCSSREYKYFIVQDGSLDVAAMQQAAQHLVGEHDYRNFCKADVLQVQNFMRRVLGVTLEPVGVSCSSMTVLALHIKGTAFLWHQVRCIAAVLLMVGRGQEQPQIVQQLLDVGRVPCKPQYPVAAEEPLLLFRCAFDELQQWHRSSTSLSRTLSVVHSQLQQHLVSAALMSAVYEDLQQNWTHLHEQGINTPQQQQDKQHQHQQQEAVTLEQVQQQQWQQRQQRSSAECHNSDGSGSSSGSSSRWVVQRPPHMPLLKRATEPSMEERFSKAGISLELLNQPGGSKLAAGSHAAE